MTLFNFSNGNRPMLQTRDPRYLGPHKIPVTREDCGSLLSEFPEYVSTLTLGIKQIYIFKSFNRRNLPSKAKTKLGIIDNKLK